MYNIYIYIIYITYTYMYVYNIYRRVYLETSLKSSSTIFSQHLPHFSHFSEEL